jgi:predicted nucleic acid-binding protein
MLVADTSAVLEALAASEPAPGLLERLSADGDRHAPHLIDTELLHALRRMNIRGEISDERGLTRAAISSSWRSYATPPAP